MSEQYQASDYDFMLAFNTYHYIFSREGKCEAYIFGGCENLLV